jgi:hypothetical protein
MGIISCQLAKNAIRKILKSSKILAGLGIKHIVMLAKNAKPRQKLRRSPQNRKKDKKMLKWQFKMKNKFILIIHNFAFGLGFILIVACIVSFLLSGCFSNLNSGDQISGGRVYIDDGDEITFRDDNKNVSIESINYGGPILDDRVVIRYRNYNEVNKIRILVTNIYMDVNNPVRSTRSYYFYTGPIEGTQPDSFYFNHSQSDLLDKFDKASFVSLIVDDVEIETHFISKL